jgi:hypothetical protein
LVIAPLPRSIEDWKLPPTITFPAASTDTASGTAIEPNIFAHTVVAFPTGAGGEPELVDTVPELELVDTVPELELVDTVPELELADPNA